MKHVLIIAVLLLSWGGLAQAEANGSSGKKKSLSVEAELGIILTSGNTDSSATNGKLDIKQDLKNWKNNYILQAFYKEDDVTLNVGGESVKATETTADRIFASAQSDYKLNSEDRGIFVYASYEDNKSSGFDYQATIAVGYSDRLFKNDTSSLDYTVGPGLATARTGEYIDANGNFVPSEKTETFAVRVSGDYVYKFTDHAKFTQKISSDIAGESDKNTKVKSETGLTATINGSMALKLSYTLNHNTKPPFGKEKTDATSAVTLVFTY